MPDIVPEIKELIKELEGGLMACMEHTCTNPDCDFFTMNNNSKSPNVCPQCGYPVTHQWDEANDDHGE